MFSLLSSLASSANTRRRAVPALLASMPALASVPSRAMVSRVSKPYAFVTGTSFPSVESR